uniref:RanBP2-type domain-containing protein n=1 Tax=Zooxanthella nutricula TaxID=1333877 RepID=A0A7S2JYY5_9DINO|mmetsp:Transcript_3808/g.11421  ORF Transcript_3808/g.11421 Transcript_3808/m.11421 type:complete len:176 (+) Transcript_3808:2-529(+)
MCPACNNHNFKSRVVCNRCGAPKPGMPEGGLAARGLPTGQGGCGCGAGGGKGGVRRLDRVKTCPFLLRVFHKIGGHHGLEAFAVRGKEPVDDELQVYTWPDVTMRELADLIKDVAPEARLPNAKLHFRLVYPDKAGKSVMTELGQVSAKRGPDDDKALAATKFQTGDLLALAIHL